MPVPWTRPTIEHALYYLNELIKLDPDAMHALVETRHPCNEALADHPTTQVIENSDGTTSVGLVGILNGLFGVDDDGWGPFTANFDNDRLVSFTMTTHRRS
jgi:hypothetical protein